MRWIALVGSIIMVIGSTVIAVNDLGIGLLLGFVAAGCVLASIMNEVPGITPLSFIWLLGTAGYVAKSDESSIVIIISSYTASACLIIGVISYFLNRQSLTRNT